jgi:non-ribosomal peptide synthetase component F
MLPLSSALSCTGLNTSEKQQLEAWNDTFQAYSKELQVHQLVGCRAAAAPDVLALADGLQSVTYEELDR